MLDRRCYVLTTLAVQRLMRGFASEAVDMAQGAFERAKGQAAVPWLRRRESAPEKRPQLAPTGVRGGLKWPHLLA